MKTNIIYNENCIGEKGMRILPDKSIDMILCDLPYGRTVCKWDKIIPLEPMWKQLKRVIKPNGAIVLTASQPFTTILIASNMKMFKYCWYWNKVKSSSFMNAKNAPMKKIENVCIFSYGTIANCSCKLMKYNPQGLIVCGKTRPPKNNSVPSQSTIGKRPSRANSYKQEFTNYPDDLIEFPFENNPVHSTQKPIALMEYLIKTYTNEGDVVLDNCIGSGTTAVACKRLNRHYIGYEISKEYVKIAKTRVEAEKTLWDMKSE